MAKKSMIERDRKRSRMTKKYANKRAKLKAVIYDKDAPMEERFKASMQLDKLPSNSSKVRQRNRCAMTGRPRGHYRKFNISRLVLRKLAQNGQLPGVTKSSW